jgi:hypothetical protein
METAEECIHNCQSTNLLSFPAAFGNCNYNFVYYFCILFCVKFENVIGLFSVSRIGLKAYLTNTAYHCHAEQVNTFAARNPLSGRLRLKRFPLRGDSRQ